MQASNTTASSHEASSAVFSDAQSTLRSSSTTPHHPPPHRRSNSLELPGLDLHHHQVEVQQLPPPASSPVKRHRRPTLDLAVEADDEEKPSFCLFASERGLPHSTPLFSEIPSKPTKSTIPSSTKREKSHHHFHNLFHRSEKANKPFSLFNFHHHHHHSHGQSKTNDADSIKQQQQYAAGLQLWIEDVPAPSIQMQVEAH